MSNLPEDNKLDRLIDTLAGIGKQLERLSDNRIDPAMDAAEAAKFLRVSETKVMELARKGEIPYSQIGRYYRFRREDLDRWLQQGGTKPKTKNRLGIIKAA